MRGGGVDPSRPLFEGDGQSPTLCPHPNGPEHEYLADVVTQPLFQPSSPSAPGREVLREGGREGGSGHDQAGGRGDCAARDAGPQSLGGCPLQFALCLVDFDDDLNAATSAPMDHVALSPSDPPLWHDSQEQVSKSNRNSRDLRWPPLWPSTPIPIPGSTTVFVMRVTPFVVQRKWATGCIVQRPTNIEEQDEALKGSKHVARPQHPASSQSLSNLGWAQGTILAGSTVKRLGCWGGGGGGGWQPGSSPSPQVVV